MAAVVVGGVLLSDVGKRDAILCDTVAYEVGVGVAKQLLSIVGHVAYTVRTFSVCV